MTGKADAVRAGSQQFKDKILRNTTTYGVLSPAKCVGLGLADTIKSLRNAIDAVRAAVIARIYESHSLANSSI